MSIGANYGIGNLANPDEEVYDTTNHIASDESQEDKALKQIEKAKREILN